LAIASSSFSVPGPGSAADAAGQAAPSATTTAAEKSIAFLMSACPPNTIVYTPRMRSVKAFAVSSCANGPVVEIEFLAEQHGGADEERAEDI
jgi:hypothetical protein